MVIDSFWEEEHQFVLKILPLLGQPFTSDRPHNYENISSEIGFDRCKKKKKGRVPKFEEFGGRDGQN